MKLTFTSPHTDTYPGTGDRFLEWARKTIQQLLDDKRWVITEENIRDSGTILPCVSCPETLSHMNNGQMNSISG